LVRGAEVRGLQDWVVYGGEGRGGEGKGMG